MSDKLDSPSYDDSSVLTDEGLDSALRDINLEPANSATTQRTRAKKRRSFIRYIGFGLLGLGVITAIFIFMQQSPKKQASVNARLSSSADERFNVQSISPSNLSQLKSDTSDNLTASPTLSVNGKLQANNSLVISPTSQPTHAVAGQVYYNETTNELGYYNGSSYTYLSGNQTSVTSLGGVSGTIAIGSGLNQSSNQLTNTGVLSLQGQTGSVTLVGGSGVAISGVRFTNTGVLAIGGQAGSISLGNGLSISNGALESSGVESITAGSPNLAVTSDGNGNITISSNGAGTGNVSAAGGNTGVIAEFNGAESLTNSLLSQSGSTITVSGALNVTNGLTLGSPLSVAYGGTGDNSLAANGILIANGSSAISSLVAGTTNECLTSTAGAPVWITCPGGNVTAAGGSTGDIPLFTGSNSISSSLLSESGSIVSLSGTLNATDLSGNGTNVTNVNAATLQGNTAAFFTNASDLSTGTLSDARLSTNVPLLNSTTNNFTGTNLEHNGNTVCDNSDNCGYLSGAAASSTFVELQGSTPGTAQTGNFNISGTGIAGTISATNLSGNGTNVTNVNAATLQGDAASYFTNASDINTGTLTDSRLSTNVPLLNATTDNFTGTNLEHNGNNVCDNSNNCGYLTGGTANGDYIELQGSTPGTAQTGNFNISGTGIAGTIKGTTLYQNGNQVCDTSGNCNSGGGGITTTGGTSGDITVFTGANTVGNSLLSESGSTVSLTGTLSATALSGNGSSVTNVNAATLQGNTAAYFTNASDITSGTLADARLSTNVPLLNATTDNFTGTNLEHNGNNVCDSSNNCGYLTTGSANGSYIELQGSTPGTAQTGNFNISGTGIATSLLVSTGGYVDTASSGTLNLGTNTASGINVGSFATTSTVGLRASTINIGVNGVASYAGVVNILSSGNGSSTYTANIGTVTAGISNVYIGATTGATTTSTVYLQGTGVTQSITNTSDVVKSLTNAVSAFGIQDSAGGSVLNEDTTANTLDVTGNLNITQTTAPVSGSFTATPASGSGLTSATTYYYAVTFVTASGQTSLGAVVAATAPTTGSNDQMSLTGIPLSSSSLVTARKVYRTKSASSSANGPFYLVTTIFNNTSTTYTDSTTDAALGATAPTLNYSGVIEENNTQIINVSTGTDDNEFFGVQSGVSLSGNTTTAIANTGVGYASLQDETTAQYNTAVGYQALQATTSGSYNAALGMDASLNNTTGANNTAFGSQALAANTSGIDNVALGSYSLNSLNAVSNTASYNTAVGYGAQQGNNEGIQNTSVGYQAGYNFGNGSAAGNNDTAIGYDAGDADSAFATLGSISNSTAIGYDAQVQASNSIVLGGEGSNAVNVGIGTTSPTNLLSVSPVAYSTGTAGTGGVFSVTVTGVGTSWTSSMVGDEFIFADGTKRNVTAVANSTSLTISSATTEPNTSSYRIQQPALEVTNSGNVGIGTVTPTANLQVTTQTNTTTAFEVQNATGSNVLDVDTANGRVGIDTSPTTSALQVAGTTSIGYTNSQGALGVYDSGSNAVFGVDTTNNLVYVSPTQSANNSTTSNNSLGLTLYSNYWNGSSSSTSAYTIQNVATASSPNYSLAFKNNGGSTVFSLNQAGAAKFQDTSDSTSDFQIQNSTGSSNLFVADTTDNAIGIGMAPTTGSSRLSVAWESGDSSPTLLVGSTSGSDTAIAIQAQTYGNTAIQATTSTGIGISSTSSSTTNAAIYGLNNAGAGGGAGVTGISTSGLGILGESSSGSSGLFESQAYANTSPTLALVQGGNGTNPQTATMFAVQTYSDVSTFTINQNGDTAIIPTNASTATFQVQNAGGGSNLFTVNTSAKQIVIGSGTANANDSLLVLNNYNAGEGSEVNGAMYYNTSLGTFRCGQNGQWVDCTNFRYSMDDQGSQSGNAPPSGDTIGNTTTLSSFTDQYAVPANDCVAGRTYQVEAGGVYSDPAGDTGTNARFMINLMWGSTAIGVQAGGSLTTLPTQFYAGNGGLSNVPWSIQATLVCYTNHLGGTSMEVNGTYSFDDSGYNNAMTDGITNNSIGQTITTGSSQNLGIAWQWGQTYTGQSVTLRNFTVNAYGP
jgi:hypothetical protein